MKNAKRSVIITAILAIIMCASLAAGATFALFTSSSSVNIAVTSGNVEVTASVVDIQKSYVDENGETVNGKLFSGDATFDEGAHTVTLSHVLPKDTVKFKVKVVNGSNVAIKYRMVMSLVEDNGLFSSLDITLNGEKFYGYTSGTKYALLEAEQQIDDISVVISLPEGATCNGSACKLTYKVEAVQGNASVEDFPKVPENTLAVNTTEDVRVLEKAISGENAVLDKDVVITKAPDTVASSLSIKEPTTLNLNAKIKTPDNMGNNKKNFTALIVDADTTINADDNGGIDTGTNGGYGINVRNGAKLTINGGYYYGGGTAVQVQEGELTINGGIFAVEPYDDPRYGYNFLLNCIDSAYKDGANIIVKGGIFVNFNPADNGAEGAHTNFVKEGYKVLATKQMNGDVWYTVVAKDAAGKTFSDGKDHVLNESIAVGAANGIAVKATSGTVTIEGGTYNGGEGGNNQSVHVANGATVTIKGGVFTVGSDASGTGNSVVESNGGNVVIEGGFFYTPYSWKGFYYVLNQQNNNPGTITVKGGTFVNYDPSKGDDHLGGNFVADGYRVKSETKANGDVWYTVVSATVKAEPVTAGSDGTIAANDVTNAIDKAFTNDKTATGVEVTLPAGSIKLKGETASAVEKAVKGKDVTFVGNGDKTTYDNTPEKAGDADYSLQGAASVTFKNMTIDLGKADYNGFVRAGNLYFENCKIIGRGTYWGVGEVVFKNCEFTAPDGDYCITLYSGKTFTFENCTFNSEAGKFINAYVEQFEGEANVVNLTNCVFNAGKANKAAICLKSYKNAIWKVTFTNCNVEQCKADGDTDDLPTGSKYYSVRNETGTVPAGTTVTVDGTVVWANGAKA